MKRFLLILLLVLLSLAVCSSCIHDSGTEGGSTGEGDGNEKEPEGGSTGEGDENEKEPEGGSTDEGTGSEKEPEGGNTGEGDGNEKEPEGDDPTLPMDELEALYATDAAVRAEMWATLETKLGEHGGEIVEGLKYLYAVYDPEVVVWLANLYDPGVGGFYYSNSAKNGYGYLPDVESTYQALVLLGRLGLGYDIGGTYADIIPAEMKTALISFVRSLQHENGFFYHPQWGVEKTDTNTGRRGRDLTWCEDILTKLGSKPIYTTPNNLAGEISASAFPIGQSASVAASKVVAAATYDPNFESVETLIAYLDTLYASSDSIYGGAAGVTSVKSQIQARDRMLGYDGTGHAEGSLMKAMIDWFDSKQDPETGLWKHTNAYNAIDGLLKVSGIYSAAQREMPNAEKIFDAALAAVLSDTPLGSAVHSYNPWNTVMNIMNITAKYGKSAMVDGVLLTPSQRVQKMRDYLYTVLPEALRKTADKISVFKHEDGSFSYSPTKKQSGVSIGMPVCVAGSYEGDTNGTSLLVGGVINGIYNAIGISYRVPIFGTAERKIFLDIVASLEPVGEKQRPKLEVNTFDDEAIGSAPYDDTALVTESPNGEGNALNFVSAAGSGANLIIPIEHSEPSANCFGYSVDIYVPTNGVDNKYFVQIIFANGAMVYLQKHGSTFSVNECTSRTNSDRVETNCLATLPCDEWFTLECKYYVGEKDTVRIKWYINGELVAVTDNYYVKDIAEGTTRYDYAPTKPSASSKFQIYGMKSPAVSMYIDNLAVYAIAEEYTKETSDGLRVNVDA